MITTPEEIYNTSAWYQYKNTLAYDMTGMFARPLTKDQEKLILFEIIFHTYRNFQDPALRFFNIQGRTKLIKMIRSHDVASANVTLLYKNCTGSYPNNQAEVETFIRSYDLMGEFGGPIRYWYNGLMQPHIDNIEKISSVLDSTSIYEWLSMFCNDANNNLNSLLSALKLDFKNINKACNKNIQEIRTPFNLIVTDHVSLANKLIGMGERPSV